jgi:hypothetical protein
MCMRVCMYAFTFVYYRAHCTYLCLHIHTYTHIHVGARKLHKWGQDRGRPRKTPPGGHARQIHARYTTFSSCASRQINAGARLRGTNQFAPELLQVEWGNWTRERCGCVCMYVNICVPVYMLCIRLSMFLFIYVSVSSVYLYLCIFM